MTAEQALEILDKATMNLSGTRQDHVMIAQALEVLRLLNGQKEALAKQVSMLSLIETEKEEVASDCVA